VKLVRRLLSHGRLRQARKRLADSPSPMTYAALAHEYAWEGDTREALRVCQEGLRAFPGNPELTHLAERTRRLEREQRMTELRRELREAPRPALWAEICEILLESDQLTRAEECAREWLEKTGDGEAQLMIARICVERFTTDRGREAGRRAFEVLEETQQALERDPRPWTLRMHLAAKVGAWSESKRCASMLLELEPGDPTLEARYRTFSTLEENGLSLEHALREVDRTGRFTDDEDSARQRKQPAQRDVRPMLQGLASEPGVHAAIYLRGSTALVQGPRGATAERSARAVRRVVKTARTTARRLGLGHISAVTLEGNFGTFAVAAGEMDAGAMWCSGKLSRPKERALMNLAGMDASTEEVPE